MRRPADQKMTGPRLLGLISLAIAAMCVLILVVMGTGPAGAHAVVRWTARTSLVLFALAYVSRPLVQLKPTRTARDLLSQRKWCGLGFAVSHVAHLLGIIGIAWPAPAAFIRSQPVTTGFALITYVLLFAMAITSIERLKKRMTPATWKRLHRAGMHAAWLTFLGTYAGALGASLAYFLPLALLVGIAGIRLAAWRRARRIALARTQVIQARLA